MILRITSNYLIKVYQQTDLCNGDVLCFLWGREWIFKYCVEDHCGWHTVDLQPTKDDWWSLDYTELFKALVKYLRRLFGRSSGVENVKIRYRLRITTSLRWCGFYYCDCPVLRNGNNLFHIACQLMSWFAMNERKQANSALYSIFNRHLRVFIFQHIYVRVVGTCQTCYRYFHQSMVTAFQLSVLSRTLSVESLSNHHNNTHRHQHKNVEIRKRWLI
jgi:hypothetical protein